MLAALRFFEEIAEYSPENNPTLATRVALELKDGVTQTSGPHWHERWSCSKNERTDLA
jgi:hypothetical protein